MIVGRLNNIKLDEETIKLRQDIVSLSPSVEKGISLEKIDQLIEIKEDCWDRIKWSFIHDFRSFDKLLLQLHYRRNASFHAKSIEIILKFLTSGYLLCNDVRYFNEFLWFNKSSDHQLMTINLFHFKENLFDGIHHKFPLASISEVENWVQSVKSTVKQAPVLKKTIRIGLLGFPYSFIHLYKYLSNLNYKPKMFFFPVHPNSIKKFILSNTLFSRFFCWYKGCRFSYKTIKLPVRDKRVQDQLRSESLDLAFHRLGFIIKNNIIKAFNLGILNNHLAVLPFIRGRSSIEYSLLFGFPIGATVHFIDEEVDTGNIISIYTYSIDSRQYDNITQLKAAISQRTDDRFVDTLKYIAGYDYKTVTNLYEKGLQYFVIHPELNKFIEQIVLPNCKGSR